MAHQHIIGISAPGSWMRIKLHNDQQT